MIPAAVRAYPALLRVGLAEMVAYRAEFLVWALTTNMPLVMLAVWHAAATEAPVEGWGTREFTAYYLSTMVVRLLTSNWVVWELNADIRHGTLAMKLLRPMHPLLVYSAPQLAAVPMRVVVVSPLVAVLAWTSSGLLLAGQWSNAWAFCVALAGAWLLQYLVMVCIGLLALFVESAIGVFEIWMALQAVMGGYLVPVELFPAWARDLAASLPFRYALSLPVEILTGRTTGPAAWSALGVQWVFVAAAGVVATALWKRGVRRFAAFGG